MAPPAKIWEKGSDFLGKAKDYFGKKQQPPPLLSERTAVLCAVLFTFLYIAPFYLSNALRSSPTNSRDSPAVIKARVRAVVLTSLASAAITIYILTTHGHAGPRDVLRLFAIWPINPMDCVKVLALVCLLFTGPLYELLIAQGSWRNIGPFSMKATIWDSWIGFRNYLFGPWFEELVFRSLVVSLYLLAKVSPTRIVLTSPLVFGAAHFHHYIEFVHTRTPAGRKMPPLKVLLLGLVPTAFQFAYTSLFGVFAAFVYLRTGNVFTCGLAHMFCNYMGLPRVWGRVGQFTDFEPHEVTPDVAQGKRHNLDQVKGGHSLTKDVGKNEQKAGEVVHAGMKDLGVAWTVIYYVLLPTGAYGFYRLLWPLTQSENALATF
ncbi:prenyl ase Rce1 [Lecanosticta acicola]|uniref:intramembrane prenyl-peptidase Rce1 n=1 Tax=Lecanosticta acicola TaxID=111012 RepID=A0AAI8YXB4_9PEZI|nr:prenyl ase Rce1 [Lecanosticta acicola]